MTLLPLTWEAAFAITCALVLLAGCIAEWVKYFREKRAAEQVIDELRLARGMLAAKKAGLIVRKPFEDIQ
jgi:hypothetical protein